MPEANVNIAKPIQHPRKTELPTSKLWSGRVGSPSIEGKVVGLGQ